MFSLFLQSTPPCSVHSARNGRQLRADGPDPLVRGPAQRDPADRPAGAALRPRGPSSEPSVPFSSCLSFLQALGGFLLILNEHGEIYYVSENIEFYLGFLQVSSSFCSFAFLVLQSDILHQPIFEMIHSEDREEIRRILMSLRHKQEPPLNGLHGSAVERVMQARFRCLLDNTCGFVVRIFREKFNTSTRV